MEVEDEREREEREGVRIKCFFFLNKNFGTN